jgi:hypothetical protein
VTPLASIRRVSRARLLALLTIFAASLGAQVPEIAGATVTVTSRSADLEARAEAVGDLQNSVTKSGSAFTAYNDSAETGDSTMDGSASAHTVQDTLLTLDGVELGAVESEATSDTVFDDDFITSSSSLLIVNFTVSSPVDFALVGSMSASGSGAHCGSANVELEKDNGMGGEEVVDLNVASPLDCVDDPDISAQKTVNESGTLSPGDYSLSENALSSNDTSGFFAGAGDGEYDLQFLVDPPQTKITKNPGHKTEDRTPTFKFKSDAPDSTFECRVDSKAFKPCQSPKTTDKLNYEEHTFQVRALNLASVYDPSAAKYKFKVVKPD